jgi:hypothetical protein
MAGEAHQILCEKARGGTALQNDPRTAEVGVVKPIVMMNGADENAVFWNVVGAGIAVHESRTERFF